LGCPSEPFKLGEHDGPGRPSCRWDEPFGTAAVILSIGSTRTPWAHRPGARFDTPMIIRHKHKGRFTVVPNAIFNDDRISLAAKGLLGYLLSRPGNWDVRHDQLQRQFSIGRKLLSTLLMELEKTGYLERDEEQGRDEYNRFTTLNYIVRDIPELVV
jgi:hypothetical protein